MLLVGTALRITGLGHLWKDLCKDFLCTMHSVCVCVCQMLSHVRLFATTWWPGSCPWNSPGKSAGVSCHSLLQGIFPTQRLNPGLPHCRQILYQLSHQGIHISFLHNCKCFARCMSYLFKWLPGVYVPGYIVEFSSVSHVWLCDPMNHSTSGLPVHHQLPEFTQTHVHRVSDAIQPSHPLSSPLPPAPNLSQHQSLFQWVNSAWGGQSTLILVKVKFYLYICLGYFLI